MYRFTTPKHTFKFPQDLDLSLLSEILITYSQNGKTVLEKRKNELIEDENNEMWFQLTQEESGKFKTGMRTEVQVRILFATGESYASRLKQVEVTRVLHNGILEEPNV